MHLLDYDYRPSTMDSIFASHPAAPGSIIGRGLKIYRQKWSVDHRGWIISNEPSSTRWWQACITKKKSQILTKIRTQELCIVRTAMLQQYPTSYQHGLTNRPDNLTLANGWGRRSKVWTPMPAKFSPMKSPLNLSTFLPPLHNMKSVQIWSIYSEIERNESCTCRYSLLKFSS